MKVAQRLEPFKIVQTIEQRNNRAHTTSSRKFYCNIFCVKDPPKIINYEVPGLPIIAKIKFCYYYCFSKDSKFQFFHSHHNDICKYLHISNIKYLQ